MVNNSDTSSNSSDESGVVMLPTPELPPAPDPTQDTGYHLERTHARWLREDEKYSRVIDFLRERLDQDTEAGLLALEVKDICHTVSENQRGSQHLVSKYALASFNNPVEKDTDHQTNDGKKPESQVPRCYISFEDTAIRKKAEDFSNSHKTDHPTLDTAADWHEQLKRFSTLARLNDVERRELVQNQYQVEHANDPLVTTQNGLSKLETKVREAERKLSGILFIGPCGTNSIATWDGKSFGGDLDSYQ